MVVTVAMLVAATGVAIHLDPAILLANRQLVLGQDSLLVSQDLR